MRLRRRRRRRRRKAAVAWSSTCSSSTPSKQLGQGLLLQCCHNLASITANYHPARVVTTQLWPTTLGHFANYHPPSSNNHWHSNQTRPFHSQDISWHCALISFQCFMLILENVFIPPISLNLITYHMIQLSYSPDYFKFSPTCVLSKHLTAEKSWDV